MKHLSHTMRSPDPAEVARGVAWIIGAYRDLGSIEAVAEAAGVHTRTMHRYVTAHPKIQDALRKAGHVFGAGNVSRRVEAGKARALELLNRFDDRTTFESIGALAQMIGVTTATIERWCRVYPGVRAVVKKKIA